MNSKIPFFLKVFIFPAILVFHGPDATSQNPPAPQSGFRSGHPADHLPPYIRMVSGFGERPDWSHDGQRILFVDKPMGEVYELDLATGLIYPKTRHFNHYGFTRAMYLANGDILLAGPNEPFDPTDGKERDRARDRCWLSVLDKSGGKKPVPLGVLCAEGPAVSRQRLRIAWTIRDRQDPGLGKNSAQLLTGEIVYENGVPRLDQQRLLFDSHRLPFPLGNSSLETQNFVPPADTQLLFTVYQIDDGNNTDTYSIDLATGVYRNLTNSPGYYDEPEGVFPDGRHTCVEHGPSKTTAWPMIDIFKLKLDGSGEMQRLTYFSDFKNYKASQGVVSDDGRFLCFQIGKSGDEAGVGYGFFVMDLAAAAEYLEPFQSFAEADPLRQPIPVILDTDTNNELDDQHALAYLLFNGDVFDVRGITVNATSSGGNIHEQYAEAERVMKMCRADKNIPLLKGADSNFETIKKTIGQPEYDGKDAVEFIIEEARKPRDHKLVLLPVGKLTNIALALAKAPDIKDKVRIVWLGSNYPEPGEHNQVNDLAALNFILDQDVPFEIVLVRYGKPSGTDAVRVTPAEIEQKMPGAGPRSEPVTGRHGGAFTHFGDYSVDLFRHVELHGDPPGRALFDMAAVAIVKNPAWGQTQEIPAPILDGENWQDRPGNTRKILLWENFDRDAILHDFYATMHNPNLARRR